MGEMVELVEPAAGGFASKANMTRLKVDGVTIKPLGR
jgi:hypothetical protein